MASSATTSSAPTGGPRSWPARVTGELDDYTIGARAKGKTGAFDYSIERAIQTGNRAGDEVWAWGLATTAGYTFDCAWKPRVM